MSRFKRLIREVHRRSLWQVVAMYIGGAWACEALGRDEEALGWYASLGWITADIFYVAPALLRVAEIYERLGDSGQAATHYRRFITRWADCDPELRPLVAGAEQALARLTAGADAP